MLAPRVFSRSISSSIKKIGIVGCGTIGTSWALQFLMKGYEVQAYDQNGSSEPRMRKFFEDYQGTVKASGLPDDVKIDGSKFKFSNVLQDLKDVDFIQESGPENVTIKRELYGELEGVIRPDVIISSSSSGIMPTKFQEGAKHPERILLGHPFNPPHLLPLVEICGGKQTDKKYMDIAKELYDAVGKSTVVMNKEIEGHIANRYQAAILQEVLYLLKEGVASAEDLEKALVDGPGLRWAVYGQLLNFHLGGGPGGLEKFFEKLGPAFFAMAHDLGEIKDFTPAIQQQATKGINDVLERHNVSNEDLIHGRDRAILNFIDTKKKFTKV